MDNTRAREAKESAVFEDLEKDGDSSDNSCDARAPEKQFDETGGISFQVESASEALDNGKLGIDCQHRVSAAGSLQGSPMVRDDSEVSLPESDLMGKIHKSIKNWGKLIGWSFSNLIDSIESKLLFFKSVLWLIAGLELEESLSTTYVSCVKMSEFLPYFITNKYCMCNLKLQCAQNLCT